MKKTILLTGMNGFLGQHVAAFLNKKKRAFRCVYVGRQQCDLRDQRATQKLIQRIKPNIIFHCAGAPAPSPWDVLADSYITTTRHIIWGIQNSSVKKCRLIVPGSAAEYGAGHKNGKPLRPHDICAPSSPYARIKLAQTWMALAARSTKLDVRVGRIFNLVGPGTSAHLVLGSWARQIRAIQRNPRKRQIEVGNIHVWRDFIDIRDAAAGLAELGLNARGPSLFNLSSGRAYQLRDLLNQLLKHAGLFGSVSIVKKKGRARPAHLDPRRIVGAPAWKPKIAMNQSLSDMLANLD